MEGRPQQSRAGRRCLYWAIALLLFWWCRIPASAEEVGGGAPGRPDPVAAEVELGRGVAAFEQGRLEEALERLGKAEGAGPGATYYRGLVLLAQRKAREALRAFEAVRTRPDAPAEVELDSAVARLAAGDLAGSEAYLRRYTLAHPTDPYGQYFLGVALFRRGRQEEALARFQQASSEAALAPYLDFYQGLSAYSRGDSGARPFFDRAQAAGIAGPSGTLVRQLNGAPGWTGLQPGETATPAGRPTLNGIPGPDPNRRWNLAFLNGYEYDTNVALAPGITPLGLGTIGNHPDSRWMVASFGEYRLIQNERAVLGLIGSTYDSFQFKLSRYNVQDYMGGAYNNLALAENVILGTRYEFHETLLDGHQFLTNHRFVPNLTLREDAFGHTTTYYELDSLGVTGFALIPAQNRSGLINAVGLTQAVYLLEGAGRFYAGYRFEQANTVGSDFDRNTHMATARVELPLPFKIVANAEARVFWDDYMNPNSLDFLGRPRIDRRVEARIGLQKFFNAHLSMRLEYLYINNNSNVRNLYAEGFYSYHRDVLSAILIYDF